MSHFEVHEVRDFWDGGERVARYHPGFAYRFTDRNRTFAQGMINNGVASNVDGDRKAEIDAKNGMRLASGQGRVSGFLQVG